ncbi:EAL domain-containing protein [Rossellomorea sp. YZS02]|uniref:EAL domain-containing protein n=1 Tax=Rossellomorea sp. YZS02 TaxID=3097358 RepID=UPI002A166765|nr:EAL domain-containing protein [Rossellomorea sp. YZS02]MDX8343092.1 EAL domain-containing protein [Rossellomorea sp. YZS02]
MMNLLRKSQNDSVDDEQLINIYELLFDRYPDPIYIMDHDGHILASNKAAMTFFDRKIKNIQHFISNCIPQPYIPDTLEHFSKAVDGEYQQYRSAHILRNGKLIETNVHFQPLFNRNEPFGVVLLISDITELEAQKAILSKLEMSVNTVEELVDLGTWDYDIVHNKALWSDQMYALFDLDMDETPTYEKVYERIHPDDRENFETQYQKAIEEKCIFSISYRIIKKDGSLRVVNQYADVLLDENRRPVRMIGTSHDITEQVHIQTKMKEQEQHVKKIYDNLDAGIWSMDVLENKILFTSKGIENISGYTSREFEEGTIIWSDLIASDDLPYYQSRQEILADSKPPKGRYRIIHKEGQVRWVEDNTIPVFNHEGTLIRLDGIITDITEQIKSEEAMAHLAYYDYLTDLPNRRMFEDELVTLIESSSTLKKQFAVLYIDMDGFKRINDTLGHQKGDLLLKEISSRLQQNTPERDLVARMGGDEFTILLRRIQDTEEAVSFARKLIRSLEEPFFINGYELFVTASIGMTLYPIDGEDPETLMGRADTALYRAKEMGKNNVQIYTSSMNIESFKVFQLEKDLRKAIKKDELLLHYQPKVDGKTGRLVGAEALIRWKHPEWGLISPHEFIPIAEENGLIIPITDWVIQTVCEQLREWEGLEVPLIPISINMSPKRFLRNDWVETTLNIIEETGVTPSLLDLEITESVLIQNEETFISSIERLKETGIRFSLDDFGTGFSSLLYLKKFNVDTVKIDRSFIRDYLNESDAEITKSIIRMAHGLRLTVVAEGVETKDQRMFLIEQDCDILQGYLFSKPVPPEDFQQFLIDPVLIPQSIQAEAPVEERREVFRIDFTYPLRTDMTIASVNGKSATVGTTEVLVENLGPGGLRFLTHLRLPVSPGIIFDFNTVLLGEPVTLSGKIVWKQEHMSDFCLYGVQFILSPSEQAQLTKRLNKLSIEVLKTPAPEGCSFIQTEGLTYLETNFTKG